MREVANQRIIEQDDEEVQIEADMEERGVQPSLEHEDIAIQYDRVNYDEFEEDLADNTPSNVFYEETEGRSEEKAERQLL